MPRSIYTNTLIKVCTDFASTNIQVDIQGSTTTCKTFEEVINLVDSSDISTLLLRNPRTFVLDAWFTIALDAVGDAQIRNYSTTIVAETIIETVDAAVQSNPNLTYIGVN